jgi:hypothetical protein
MIETTTCPECGVIAAVQWRTVLESTDGPIEHARVRCATGHHFLLPVAHLAVAGRGPRVAARESSTLAG